MVFAQEWQLVVAGMSLTHAEEKAVTHSLFKLDTESRLFSTAAAVKRAR